MTRDDIIRMAREAGFQTGVMHGADGTPVNPLVQPIGNGCIVEIERFAALVASAEREACAKLADEYATWGGSHFNKWFKRLAVAIRARGAA